MKGNLVFLLIPQPSYLGAQRLENTQGYSPSATIWAWRLYAFVVSAVLTPASSV